MKIFILGIGKSGTTAMAYKVAGGLSDCQAFCGGKPGKHLGDYENAVYKHTYEENKGKSFKLYREHLKKVHYDRKIWLARDPRDTAVSRLLYRWHKGIAGEKEQFKAYYDLILRKEKSPRSVSFVEICRYASFGEWPASKEQVIDAERLRYQRMTDFCKTIEPGWFLYKYEDMATNQIDGINRYLGFSLKPEAEVPRYSRKYKVVRKKASGDWRHWFTAEDISLLKPVYLSYMQVLGYDCDDWTLAPNPVVEPQFSSVYVENLISRSHSNLMSRFCNTFMQLLRSSGTRSGSRKSIFHDEA
jgi:hypothetical protein